MDGGVDACEGRSRSKEGDETSPHLALLISPSNSRMYKGLGHSPRKPGRFRMNLICLSDIPPRCGSVTMSLERYLHLKR